MLMNNTNDSNEHRFSYERDSQQRDFLQLQRDSIEKRTSQNSKKVNQRFVTFRRAIELYSSIESSHKFICKTVLFISMAMITAIITICLTSPKPSKSCQSSFKSVIRTNSFQHNSNPHFLANGDFDHNHFLDIVVVNSGTNNIGIFLNDGNGTFAPQMTFPTGDYSGPLSLALGDFNNDTHLDIAVANYNTHNIGIFLGYGNGNFTSQTTFSTGASRPVSLAVGDVNNDYYVDIVIANNGTNNVGILFGYGNGSFTNLTTYSTGYDSLPYSIVIQDFNNDHHLDIAVANYGTNNVGIFHGYGNGSFTTQITYSTSPQSNPYSIAVNDFNNDRQFDIAVANSGTDNVGIFLGYENGSFAPQMKYPISPGSNPHSIIIGDFNQDNQLDIAVSNYNTNNVSILTGYGNGSFATPTMHSTGIDADPLGMTVGDFNNDDQSDIAVANSGTNNVLVLIGYRMTQSENPPAYSTGYGSHPFQIATGDLNNDTQLDLIVANRGTNNIGVFLGYGNGSFGEQITYSTGNNSYPYAVIVNDLDNDYHLDIVVANGNSASVGILYGYGNGNFTTLVTYFTGDFSSPQWVTVDDVNNDNHLDIIFADFSTGGIGIFLGFGNRTFGNLMKYSSEVNSEPCSIATEDFNNDGRLDIIVANYGTDNIAIFLGSGNGTFTLFTTYSTGEGSFPQMLIIADVNKDNHSDIIVANSGTDNVGVFFGFSNGSLSAQVTYSTSRRSIPTGVSVADLNNDSWLDLVVANSGINKVGVLLGNGLGYFGNQTTYFTGLNSLPLSIGVGDFNKDNRLDIAVANYGVNNVAILLGHPSKDSINRTVDVNDNVSRENQSNSTITNYITNDVPILLGDYYVHFLSQTTYSTGASSHPYTLVVGDLNHDTHIDLVVTNSGNENLGILLGSGNGNFATETIHSTGVGSSPQYLVIDDFNKDNQLDVAVNNPRDDSIIVFLGNGNGTFATEMIYSTGSGSNPSSLAINDFNNDNYLDLIVAHKETDVIGIFFGFHYTSFARQNPCESGENSIPTAVFTGDFNNDGYLDIVSSLYGTNNVGVFLGYGNGTFTPLMTFGQVPLSHPYSVAVGDFNNDNQLDITVTYAGTDSVGVILGYGNGTFTNPILYSTGFGTNPLSVAVGDFNNDHCLDITAANYLGNSVAVFFGYGNGDFRNVTTLPTGKGSRSTGVTVYDINNDTQLDIIVANEGINNVGVFLGYGNGSFSGQLTSSTGVDSRPLYVVAADFNKDGRLDLAIANGGTSNVGILYGYGDGTFGNLQTYTTGIGSDLKNINIGDFNNDGHPDIIVATGDADDVGVLFGYSDGTFASLSTVPTGQDASTLFIAIGDFNNDNRLDFAIADIVNNNIGVLLSYSMKPFGQETIFSLDEGTRPSSLVTGHFNNDNHLDIVIANYGTNNIGILLGYGNRSFSDVITYSTGDDSHPMSLAIGDFNNDSINDIVIANSQSDNIIVFIGYGNGSFSMLTTYSTGESSQPVSIAVGHFNRDYQLDIVVANFGTNNVCVLFGDGNGAFTNRTYYPLGYDSRPNFIVFRDVNNDNWEDLAVVTSGIDNINIRLNLC